MWHVIQKELKTTDQETLDIVNERVAASMPRAASEAVMEIDEACEVLEEQDRKLIAQGEQKAKKRRKSD